MPISLSTDTSSLAHPTSENLLMLIMITGGLLFICILLLLVVVLRAKARRKKASMPDQPKVVKEPKPKKEKKVKEVVAAKKPDPIPPIVKEVVIEKKSEPIPVIKEEKKEVIEIVIKKEEPKPIVEKVPVAETKIPEPKKEEPKVEIKTPLIETKKLDEVIIKIEEKKPETTILQETKKTEILPTNTSIEQKKKEFNKALEETHSKEDNLKILQERLAELSKDKKTTVTFVETPKKENTIDEAKVEEKKQVQHEKLVDLTALINEKLQSKTEPVKEPVKPIVPSTNATDAKVSTSKDEKKNEEPVVPIVPVIKEEPKKEDPKVEVKSEKESHEILTPFLNKITANTEAPVEEKPETIINKIDEELKTIAEKETNPSTNSTDAKISTSKDDTSKEKPQDTTSQQKDQVPKTFTEWLNTLKK